MNSPAEWTRDPHCAKSAWSTCETSLPITTASTVVLQVPSNRRIGRQPEDDLALDRARQLRPLIKAASDGSTPDLPLHGPPGQRNGMTHRAIPSRLGHGLHTIAPPSPAFTSTDHHARTRESNIAAAPGHGHGRSPWHIDPHRVSTACLGALERHDHASQPAHGEGAVARSSIGPRTSLDDGRCSNT